MGGRERGGVNGKSHGGGGGGGGFRSMVVKVALMVHDHDQVLEKIKSERKMRFEDGRQPEPRGALSPEEWITRGQRVLLVPVWRENRKGHKPFIH